MRACVSLKDFLPPKRGCVSRENTQSGCGQRRKQEKPRRHTPDRRDGILMHQSLRRQDDGEEADGLAGISQIVSLATISSSSA